MFVTLERLTQGQPHREQAAVLAPVDALPAPAPELPEQPPGQLLAQLRRGIDADVTAQELLDGVAVHPRVGGVDVDDPALGVGHRDADLQRLEGLLEDPQPVLDVVVGYAMTSDRATAVRNVVLLILLAMAVKNAAAYGAASLGAHVQEGVARDMREYLYAHTQRLGLSFFHRMKGGQLVSRMIADIDQACRIVSTALVSAHPYARRSGFGPVWMINYHSMIIG